MWWRTRAAWNVATIPHGVSRQYVALELLRQSGFGVEILDEAIAIKRHLLGKDKTNKTKPDDIPDDTQDTLPVEHADTLPVEHADTPPVANENVPHIARVGVSSASSPDDIY